MSSISFNLTSRYRNVNDLTYVFLLMYDMNTLNTSLGGLVDNLDRKLVGQRILKIRQRRGMTQKQVAELAGLGESTLRSYELGNRKPKEKHLEKIAAALEVRPEALKEYGITTNEDAARVLFRLQAEERLEPQIIDGKPCLVPPLKSEPMRKLLRDWKKGS